MAFTGFYILVFFQLASSIQACPFLCNCIFNWDSSESYEYIWHCGHQGISNNQLDLITKDQNVSDVNILYLDNNKFDNLDASKLKEFTALKTLSLVENRITLFPSSICKDLPSLKTIILANNSIESLTSDSFTNCNKLKFINLSGNNIHLLGNTIFSSLGSLQKMDLSRNGIHKLSGNSLDGLQSLTELDLSSNKIKEIPNQAFGGIHNVVTLDVSSNEIIVLNKDIFQTLSHMEHLDLSKNTLSNLEDSTFQKLNIDFLDLSFNKIKQIKKESFVDATILSLNLVGNPLLCDCSLKSLIVYPGENETKKVPIVSNIDGYCSFVQPRSVSVSIQNLTSSLYCGFQCSGNTTCKNGGTCLMQESKTKHYFYQQCECPDDYFGTLCKERRHKKPTRKTALLIIIIVGIPLLILLVGLVVFFRECRRIQQRKSDVDPLTDDDFSL